MQNYPIGTPGEPWGEEEKAQWKAQQTVKRSYQEEVLNKLFNIIPEGFELKQYGALPYDTARYPLYVVFPRVLTLKSRLHSLQAVFTATKPVVCKERFNLLKQSWLSTRSK